MLHACLNAFSSPLSLALCTPPLFSVCVAPFPSIFFISLHLWPLPPFPSPVQPWCIPGWIFSIFLSVSCFPVYLSLSLEEDILADLPLATISLSRLTPSRSFIPVFLPPSIVQILFLIWIFPHASIPLTASGWFAESVILHFPPQMILVVVDVGSKNGRVHFLHHTFRAKWDIYCCLQRFTNATNKGGGFD